MHQTNTIGKYMEEHMEAGTGEAQENNLKLGENASETLGGPTGHDWFQFRSLCLKKPLPQHDYGGRQM